MGMGMAFSDDTDECNARKRRHELTTTANNSVKSVLAHIKEDIEFGYDAQMILNKIKNGNYDN